MRKQFHVSCNIHRICAHLHEIFGAELGRNLLYLAIYKLAGGTTMTEYDLWYRQVWLPDSVRLCSQTTSEILTSVTKEHVSKYFRLRHDRQLQMRQQLIEKYPELKGQKIEYTLDSTSISSYSHTNALFNMAVSSQMLT